MTLSTLEQRVDRIVRYDYVPAVAQVLGRPVVIHEHVQDGRRYPLRETTEGLEWRFDVPGTEPLAFSRLQIKRDAIAKAATDGASFARALQREVKSMAYDLERELARQAEHPLVPIPGTDEITALPLVAPGGDIFVSHPDYGLLNGSQAEYVAACERDAVAVDLRELTRRDRW